MNVTDRSWARIGASTGFGFVLLLVLAYLLGPNNPPAYGETAETVNGFVGAQNNEIRAGAALVLGALVFFAFFIGALAAHNRRNEIDGRLSATAHAGGITAIAVAAGGAAVASGAAAASQSGSEAHIVEAIWNVQALGFSVAAIGTAILFYATGILALRSGSFPGWYGIASVVAGVYTAVVAIISVATRSGAFSPYDGELPVIALLVLAIWVLVTSGLLFQLAPVRARRR